MNKRILPSKSLLQNMVYDFGVKSVLENYGSADMLMGSVESMEYYQSIREQYESMER